jgi:hypothetical protein
MRPVPRWTPFAAASAFLLLLAWAYWPGLAGPFLFDDYGNLDVLGAYGRMRTWPDFLYYLTSGNADPTGRPIALLSFLLDAHSWPADPWPFKRTNLVLHLFNAALLAVVLARLQSTVLRGMPGHGASRWTPLVAAALWAAHPFFVSTTLYVVQREAMLPMTFALLGLLAWSQAVSRFEAGRSRAGWGWAICGVGAATLLAGLSKANGLLTPALAGLTYLWFQRPLASMHRRTMDRAAAICLGIPSLLLLAYLANTAWNLWGVAQIPGRDWTLTERLLSEPRALCSYLWRLLLPRAGGGGLFVEDFPVSRGWLDPWTTLPAILALVAATTAAIGLRRRFPIASFAWLFFLVAHLLESSVVPLEIYFEHRNYLPAAMLGWPLAHALVRPGRYRAYRCAAVALLLGMLLLLTRERATVWGNPQLLGTLSAIHESDSARAQADATNLDIEHGRIASGLARIHAAQRREPESVDVAIAAITAECAATGVLDPETLARARHTLATSRIWNNGLYDWLQAAASDSTMRRCRGFGLRGLQALVDSAEANPQTHAPLRRRNLLHVRGWMALAEGDPQAALGWFDAVLQLVPDPDYALVQAAALGNAGAPALGVRHLDHYRTARPEALSGMPRVHAWLLDHFGYYRNELMSLRQQLQADADKPASAQRN